MNDLHVRENQQQQNNTKQIWREALLGVAGRCEALLGVVKRCDVEIGKWLPLTLPTSPPD
jgi:hypothetical protein